MLAGLRKAAAAPQLYAEYLHGTRRVLPRRFPYALVYLEWQGVVFLVAVAHASRRPGYWVGRVGQEKE